MFAGAFPVSFSLFHLMMVLGQNLNLALGYDEYAGIPVQGEGV